jgi:hypothetical protein
MLCYTSALAKFVELGLQEQDSEEPSQRRATALGMELNSGDIEFSAFSPR